MVVAASTGVAVLLHALPPPQQQPGLVQQQRPMPQNVHTQQTQVHYRGEHATLSPRSAIQPHAANEPKPAVADSAVHAPPQPAPSGGASEPRQPAVGHARPPDMQNRGLDFIEDKWILLAVTHRNVDFIEDKWILLAVKVR